LKRQRTLARIESYPKVTEFLESISRINVGSARSYSFALSYFQTFLQSRYKKYDIETVLIALQKKKIDVYSLLDNFVGYLTLRQDASNGNTRLSPNSIRLYFAGVESYLADNDIETSKRKLKRRVRLPKKYKSIKDPLNAQDIRDILLSCKHDTLKAFLLVLASSGMRAMEALTLRNCDVDFSTVPTKIHIRAEISKTKQENYIYISNEATKELKKFIDSKYGKIEEIKNYPNHLIFSKEIFKVSAKPINMYRMLHEHFIKLLAKVEKDKRRDGQGIQRREINFHLFRTFVYTTINNSISNTQFAEWVLGHSGSTYWSTKEPDRRELYQKCMKYLTFLDYPTVESVGKDFESKLEEQEKRHQAQMNQMDEKYNQIIDAMSKNPILSKVKTEALKKKIKKK
jgi:integrase